MGRHLLPSTAQPFVFGLRQSSGAHFAHRDHPVRTIVIADFSGVS
jgi:hypothetical protein